MSFPGYSGIVKRANYVKIKSLDRKGKPFTLQGEGYLARCIQHEIDHLDGILYIDRIEGNELYNEQTHRRVNLLDVIRLSKPGS